MEEQRSKSLQNTITVNIFKEGMNQSKTNESYRAEDKFVVSVFGVSERNHEL
jgi:hypothetical protein